MVGIHGGGTIQINNLVLKVKRIQASSIAEVVVALAVIAICFGVASLVFVRTTRSTSRFGDVKKQTEIQSQLFENLVQQDLDALQKPAAEIDPVIEADENNDSLIVLRFYGDDQRIIWEQQSAK